MADQPITITIEQTGFHGRRGIPIEGTRWRTWNAGHIACDMTAEAIDRMSRAATCCTVGCVCGGYYLPEPADPDGTTWLVPLSWITDQHRAAHPAIEQAARQCERWLDDPNTDAEHGRPIDHLHEHCVAALDGLVYRYRVAFEPLPSGSVVVSVQAEGADADPCRGQHEVLRAAWRVDGVLQRHGYRHIGHGYGHSGGYASWHVEPDRPAPELSASNRRRLLARLADYAHQAKHDDDRQAFDRLRFMLTGRSITPALASGMAAAIHAGGVQRRRALWMLGVGDASGVDLHDDEADRDDDA